MMTAVVSVDRELSGHRPMMSPQAPLLPVELERGIIANAPIRNAATNKMSCAIVEKDGSIELACLWATIPGMVTGAELKNALTDGTQSEIANRMHAIRSCGTLAIRSGRKINATKTAAMKVMLRFANEAPPMSCEIKLSIGLSVIWRFDLSEDWATCIWQVCDKTKQHSLPSSACRQVLTTGTNRLHCQLGKQSFPKLRSQAEIGNECAFDESIPSPVFIKPASCRLQESHCSLDRTIQA